MGGAWCGEEGRSVYTKWANPDEAAAARKKAAAWEKKKKTLDQLIQDAPKFCEKNFKGWELHTDGFSFERDSFSAQPDPSEAAIALAARYDGDIVFGLDRTKEDKITTSEYVVISLYGDNPISMYRVQATKKTREGIK